MSRTVTSYCRICEAHCGIEVTVDGDRVTQVRPDKDHPVSQGYACIKGAGLGELHHDPDRVNHPLKRTADGWQRISWKQALSEIGAKVRRLRRRHGNRSIALYTGNPTYFSFQNVLFSQEFLEALGSPNLFASHSIDVNSKFHVSAEMYGQSLVHPVPDFERLNFFLCLGSNPVVSQMSVVQMPHALKALRAIEKRGRVVHVDPRRNETAQKVGEHVAIRPGTDAYFLLALLHVVREEGVIDRSRVEAVATGLDDLLEVAREYSPERVAEITGVEAATLRELGSAYAAADGAAIYMSTGVNMGPFGSIAYWVLQSLNLVTGNLDRQGGLLVPEGPFPVLKLAQWMGLGGKDRHRTKVRSLPRVAGAFPVSALAEEIQTSDPERIRALFVSAGNPLHSVPGAELGEALDDLDLLVAIDLYRSETAERAHYVLPATDMLEHSDYPVSWALLQPRPYAQFTEAVVPPAHERREEWRIFSDLALACGARPFGTTVLHLLPRLNRLLRRLPGTWEVEPEHLLAVLLRWGGKVSLKELRAQPRGLPLPPTEPGSFLGKRVATPDRKVRLAPPALLDDLARLDEWAGRFARTDDRLWLIGRRERKSHNSWMHNNRFLSQPDGPEALLHPEDGAGHGIETGSEVEIRSDAGRLHLRARLTPDVARGVISVPHGWGHQGSGLSRAAGLGGDNVNRIIPGGTDHIEPHSGQAIMSAIPVEVGPADLGDA